MEKRIKKLGLLSYDDMRCERYNVKINQAVMTINELVDWVNDHTECQLMEGCQVTESRVLEAEPELVIGPTLSYVLHKCYNEHKHAEAVLAALPGNMRDEFWDELYHLGRSMFADKAEGLGDDDGSCD